MGIFSKSIEAAQAAVTKAEQVVADWEAKAADARAEASRLEAESGAAILADESATERITLNIQVQERKARAYDGAAAEARRKLLVAQREALEVEAKEEDKLAAAAAKAAEAHGVKVSALLSQLRELDEVHYIVGVDPAPGFVRDRRSAAGTPKSFRLQKDVKAHVVRAALIRYYIETGKIAQDIHDLNSVLGTSLEDNMRTISGEGIEIPKSLYAARDAGLAFTAA